MKRKLFVVSLFSFLQIVLGWVWKWRLFTSSGWGDWETWASSGHPSLLFYLLFFLFLSTVRDTAWKLTEPSKKKKKRKKKPTFPADESLCVSVPERRLLRCVLEGLPVTSLSALCGSHSCSHGRAPRPLINTWYTRITLTGLHQMNRGETEGCCFLCLEKIINLLKYIFTSIFSSYIFYGNFQIFF